MPQQSLRRARYAAKGSTIVTALATLMVGILLSAIIGGCTGGLPAWGDEPLSSGGEQPAWSDEARLAGDKLSARVIYHFVPEDEITAHKSSDMCDFSTYHDEATSVTTGEVRLEKGRTIIQTHAVSADLGLDPGQATLRVLKDYASAGENEGDRHVRDLSEQARFNPETGEISLPGEYAEDDLTIVWYVSQDARKNLLPVAISVSKTIDGAFSRAELTHDFKADAQAINLKLFDDEEDAARISDITITQGGAQLDSFVYQNGFISLLASPLGGTISIELSDGSEVPESATNWREDDEVEVNDSVPLFSVFSAANPSIGERFYLSAGSAFIRTCESSSNMAQLAGWPSKDHTYGFVVHFNSCPNPEVVNADQNHIAAGGTYHNSYGDTIDYSWIQGMHFAWGDCYGDVDSNGGGEPVVQSGWVEVTNVDYGTQTVSYRYFLDVCADTNGHNMQSIVGTFQVHEDLIGYLEIKKQSGLPDLSDGNACYSLAGAQYGIYADEACSDLKDTLTTDSQGAARSRALLVGTYYIKELVAPEGYALDPDVHTAAVSAGTTRSVQLNDVPQSDPTPILIGKHDSIFPYNGDHNNVQGGASTLKDAQFKVTFYPTLEEDYASITPTREWVFKTNEHGLINLRDGNGCKVSGDELFYDSHGFITLPIGTYVIDEIKAPEGYNVNGNTEVRRVTGSANGEESVSSFNTPVVADEVIRGGVEIEKRDAESGLLSPLGSASLDGAVFTITNENAHPVSVGGIFFQPGEVCQYLVIVGGKASTRKDALPFGEYSLREVAPGEGYNPTSRVWEFSITREGQIVHFTDTESESSSAIKNQVKRGDLNFIKVREDDGERLEEVPFRITSKTTGETHVVVSDKNGIVDTSSEWIAHTQKTNANDSGERNAGAGIWFGATHAGTTTDPRDELGALPYDSYTLEELPCAANEGLELVKVEFSIYRDKQQLDFGVVENHIPDEPWISTVATDGIEHDKLLFAASDAQINDHVRYGNLVPGQAYTLEATLYDTATGEKIEGAGGRCDFTPASATGTTEVSISANLLDENARDVVVYETLLQDDNVLLEHHDLNNSEQTLAVALPTIGTSAYDSYDGDHELLNSERASIVDVVHFQNLVPDEEYVLHGTLMLKPDAEDESAQACEFTDSNGAPITAEIAFAPREREGSVDVTFDFDASALEPGGELVVFERLTHNDAEVAAHIDIDDASQTVKIAEPPTPSNDPEPVALLPESQKGNFDKTASALLPWLAGSGVLGGGAACLFFFGYRQRKMAQTVTAAIARNMTSPRGRFL